MPRARSAQSAYQYHTSGQAKVRLGGDDFYLGKHGTPDSYAKFYALLAEYNSTGKAASAKDKKSVTHQADMPILVKHVTADFRHRVLPDYLHNEAHYGHFVALLNLLDKRHGDDCTGCLRWTTELSRLPGGIFAKVAEIKPLSTSLEKRKKRGGR